MRRIAALLAIFLLAPAAGSPVAGGYQEAVFSVRNADQWVEFFTAVAGWEVLYDGEADSALINAWQLDSSVAAREVVVGNPGTSRGFVRLLQFRAGAPLAQRQIRSNAQTWDTGGWFDVNSRILDMDKKFAELQRRDWQAASDPVEFTFGPFVVKEWLARGPDGIVIALIERLQPPLEGHSELREMGRLINATQIVTDIESAKHFYTDKLGFEIYLDHSGPSKQPGPNVLGLPHNIAAEVTRHVTILHPHGINEGSVELIEFVGASGHDFSQQAVPPNLGVLMLRFPVANIKEFAAHAREQGIDIAFPPRAVSLPPYGDVELMGIRGPGGVWIEFFSSQQ